MKIRVAKVRSETRKRGRVKFEIRPRSTTRGNEMGTKIKNKIYNKKFKYFMYYYWTQHLRGTSNVKFGICMRQMTIFRGGVR
jgi:hypothetical protein